MSLSKKPTSRNNLKGMDFLISDLHLHQGQKFVPELFQYFMKNIAPEADNLFVLGDLFEYWVGDDFETEFTLNIIDSFKRFSDSGKNLFFIHGNRDFLLGDKFIRSTGGTLLSEFTITNTGTVSTLLMHGDTLCSEDENYQTFRKQVREPAWQKEFLKQPLQKRQQIAEQLRDESIADQKTKSAEIMDVTASEVSRAFTKYNVTRIIHGHTHRQFHHYCQLENQSVERIVLGDWGKTGNYCKCENNNIELINFS
jgi:UDP-2,3-diacylglucosamine hydrolase